MNSTEQIPLQHQEIDEWIAEPTDGVLEALQGISGDFMVLGAGGKMGASTALMLKRGLARIDKAARVFAVSRFSDTSARERLESFGIETLSADMLDRAAVERLPDAANILFLVGQKFGTGNNPESTWATNTIAPAWACERFRNSLMVALSTGCVYPFVDVNSDGSDESAPIGPVGDYANSCVGRERVLGYFSRHYNIPMALIRLNYAIDPRYGVLLDIGTRVRNGTPVSLETGWVNFIWQGDAVARTIQCFAHAAVPPFIINITGPDKVPVRRIAETFGKLFDKKPVLSGREMPTAWLSNAARSVELFGPPRYGTDDLIGIVARHLQSGGVVLDKPTHFQSRNGEF